MADREFKVNSDGTGVFRMTITEHMLGLLLEDFDLLAVGQSLDEEVVKRAAARGYRIVRCIGLRHWKEMGDLLRVIETRYVIERIPDRDALGHAG